MFIAKKHLSRRTLLRGLGVSLSLPLLDSMIPAQTPLILTAAKPQLRLGFMYIPHGGVMRNWTPVKEGADFKLSRTLAPLQNVKDQTVILSNLAHKNAQSHGGSPPAFLSGKACLKTEGENVRAAKTIDQMLAEKMGQDTPLPSLELATEDTTGLLGACDVGFSCTYINTISWRTDTSPLPMEINPRAVFDRVFGNGSSAEERLMRIQRERSILDMVTGQVKSLQGNLGANDRNKVAEYLDNIREIERRIQLAEKQNAGSSIALPTTPYGIPDDHEEHSHLMTDLMALAFQADVTRVSTFMMAREVSYRTFPQVGVPDPFHATSHHQNDPEKLEKLTRINTFHVGLVARLMEKLKSIKDGDGTLLDHSLIMYGSCMSNSNVHDHSPLPVFIGGGACGQVKGGRHLKFPDETPMANLLGAIVNMGGIQTDKIGDGTGILSI
jgi:uncharacterized protein DUF1552